VRDGLLRFGEPARDHLAHVGELGALMRDVGDLRGRRSGDRGGRRSSGRRSGGSGRRNRTGLGAGKVGLDDAAVRAGARDGGEIDALLLGDATRQR